MCNTRWRSTGAFSKFHAMANRTANYEGIDDPGALKAILRAKDSALSTVEQRLAMQRDALANMKES
eukprot:2635146-Rhodomonas_salina.2